MEAPGIAGRWFRWTFRNSDPSCREEHRFTGMSIDAHIVRGHPCGPVRHDRRSLNLVQDMATCRKKVDNEVPNPLLRHNRQRLPELCGRHFPKWLPPPGRRQHRPGCCPKDTAKLLWGTILRPSDTILPSTGSKTPTFSMARHDFRDSLVSFCGLYMVCGTIHEGALAPMTDGKGGV